MKNIALHIFASSIATLSVDASFQQHPHAIGESAVTTAPCIAGCPSTSLYWNSKLQAYFNMDNDSYPGDDSVDYLVDLLRETTPRKPRQRNPSGAKSFGQGLMDDSNEDLTKMFALGVESDNQDILGNQIPTIEKKSNQKHTVPVRFVNFNPNNPYDYRSAVVEKGKNLMELADELGVTIPRNCKSGICGSCVADLVDSTNQNEQSQPGKQTIRLCSVGATLPEGIDEMIIDCYRNSEILSIKEELDSPRRADAVAIESDRFSNNWESEFQPDWAKESSSSRVKVGSKPSPTGRLDVDIAPEEDLAIELAKAVKAARNLKTMPNGKRRLPLAGSASFKAGMKYKWYKGNLSTLNQKQQRRRTRTKLSKQDWTFHDIDIALGGIFTPDVADGIAPWDRI